MDRQNLLMVGVGGQGIILASDILGEVALAFGYDVKKTDTLGMAQRGGSVVSHVRLADRVWSPLIREGETDMLIAFEKLEAARWAHFLRPGGIAIVNNYAMPPLSVSLGVQQYPTDVDVEGILKQLTERICFAHATSRARDLGDVRILNMFMLGLISSSLPMDVDVWEECMVQRLPSKVLNMNLTAFGEGRKEASNVNLG